MFISILVPNYNNKIYLKQCLESLINQTFNHSKYEILVFDDCSTDDSKTIIKHYKNIKLISSSINVGLSIARSELIRHSSAKTTHILFVDSDDFISLDCLENLVKKSYQYPNNIIACKTIKKGRVKSTTRGGRISIINTTQHSKLWPKSNLKNIIWPSRLKNEDDYVIPWALGKQEFVIAKNAIYHHRVVKGSLSTIKNKKNAMRIVDLALNNWPLTNRNLALLHHSVTTEGAGRYYKKMLKLKKIKKPNFFQKWFWIGFKRTFSDFWTDILFH